MEGVLATFAQAIGEQNGYLLADTISPIAPGDDSGRLYAIQRSGNAYSIQNEIRNSIAPLRLDKQEATAWTDVYVAYWKAIGEILAAEEALNASKSHAKNGTSGPNWVKVYESWKEVLNAVIRGYQTQMFDAWTIPCLYVTGKFLRVFAIKADTSAKESKNAGAFSSSFSEDITDENGGNEKLEDAARQINRVFGMCLSDRAPLQESRKWGIYYIANLLFKTYFRVNSISLSKNILRSISAAASDMPPVERFPKAHQVTFNYYVGVIYFLDEAYIKAEEQLTAAYNQALATSSANVQLILTYLIPTRLLTSHVLPTQELLAPYPSLQRLFGPLSACIKRGDLAGFDAALQAGEDEFVKRRIYLTLERGRDVCLRNLFRKVYLSGGFEELKEGQTESEAVRRSRIPLAEFGAALRVAGEKEIDGDEVECLIANLVYKVSHFAASPVRMTVTDLPIESDERLYIPWPLHGCDQ